MSSKPATYETCREAWDDDLASPSPREWALLQNELQRWQVREYGVPTALQMAAGVVEEMAEFYDSGTMAAYLDAIGDVSIYAMQMASLFRLDFGEVARAAEANGAMGAIPSLRHAFERGGRLLHVALKESQGIRGMDNRDRARRAVYAALVDVVEWCLAGLGDIGYLDPTPALHDVVSRVARGVMARNKAALPEVTR